MNSVMIPALAAIAGSLVGALGSAFGTWITARHQDRRDLLGKQIAPTGGAVFRLHWRKRALAASTPCSTTPVIFKNCYQFTRC